MHSPPLDTAYSMAMTTWSELCTVRRSRCALASMQLPGELHALATSRRKNTVFEFVPAEGGGLGRFTQWC